MRMTERTRCPNCDQEMPLNAPQGLCPACLLNEGKGILTQRDAGDRWWGSQSFYYATSVQKVRTPDGTDPGKR
jgi:hypothetical protein